MAEQVRLAVANANFSHDRVCLEIDFEIVNHFI